MNVSIYIHYTLIWSIIPYFADFPGLASCRSEANPLAKRRRTSGASLATWWSKQVWCLFKCVQCLVIIIAVCWWLFDKCVVWLSVVVVGVVVVVDVVVVVVVVVVDHNILHYIYMQYIALMLDDLFLSIFVGICLLMLTCWCLIMLAFADPRRLDCSCLH